MKVLVLGATGFVGLPVCHALVRAGHYVVALTRSQEKAKQLAAEEIIPVIGEIDKPSGWIEIIKDIDSVIDCVAGSGDTSGVIRDAAQKLRPQSAAKLTYIYTSGTWVHGDNRTDMVTDTTPILKSPDLVAWRPAREQLVINDKFLCGIVIRPALLYGRSGSLLAPFFKSASEGQVWYPGTPGGRFALIHADDLADLYLRVVEKAAICGGLIFDAANSITESTDDLLAALVKVSGAKGPYEYRTPTSPYETALGTTTLLRPYLAKSLLGWTPSKPGLVDGLPVYYAAWKASQ